MPAWAIGVGAILGALGGAGGVKSIVESINAPKPATAEQQGATLDLVRRVEAKLDAHISDEKRERERNARRWEIEVGHGCRLNGGPDGPVPYARGQSCDDLVWEPPPLGKQGPWRSRAEWPKP